MIACNLASGSKGNVTYVNVNGIHILIDVGRNKKYIVQSLASIGVNFEDIDYIFLTHTHDDHTSALNTFLKEHKATLVITSKMLKELNNVSGYKTIIYEDNPNIDGINIETLIMSHDTDDTRAFIFKEGSSSFAYITDTGYINSRYINKLKGHNAYFIECNHDIEMLTHGPYPAWLKKRVLSDNGHLSNRFTGMYLSRFINENTSDVILIHLSETNNSEKIALDTVYKALKDVDITKVKFSCARPNEISEVIEL